MHPVKHWLKHNWFLKLLSLLLATTLWVAVASEISSEIGMDVPLEYRNVPPEMEITGDATNTVEVRLRGSANLIKEVSVNEVSAAVDLGNTTPGEKTLTLTAQNVQAPFGTEVIRISPSQVRLNLEQTISKTVSIVPTTQGEPADGFALGAVMVSPAKIRVQGPESRLKTVDSISTVPIRIDGKRANLRQAVGLDLPDPQLRLQDPSRVEVRIEIRKAPR